MLGYSVWCVTVSATVNCSVHSFKKAEKKHSPRYLVQHNREFLSTERIERWKKGPQMAHSVASGNFLGCFIIRTL